jgi:cysteine synthase A
MKYEHILEGIGNTPHVRIRKLFPGAGHIWMKLERSNPGGASRIALPWP